MTYQVGDVLRHKECTDLFIKIVSIEKLPHGFKYPFFNIKVIKSRTGTDPSIVFSLSSKDLNDYYTKQEDEEML
jgi:hypothetical protein